MLPSSKKCRCLSSQSVVSRGRRMLRLTRHFLSIVYTTSFLVAVIAGSDMTDKASMGPASAPALRPATPPRCPCTAHSVGSSFSLTFPRVLHVKLLELGLKQLLVGKRRLILGDERG